MQKTGVRVSVTVVIPARYGSTRFAGKPLAMICGKMMIQRVYENAAACPLVDRVVVATEHEAVAAAVAGFGGCVCMTSPNHATGTDRIAEAVRNDDADIIVNVQGDEPLLPPEAIETAIHPILRESTIQMTTLKTRIRNPDEVHNPNVVKVVTDRNGFALYFSRAPIPCAVSHEPDVCWYRHVGLYAYTRRFLETFAALPQTQLEKAERLEQLRALEHGYPIRVVETDYEPVGVDVPEDIVLVENRIRRAANIQQ